MSIAPATAADRADTVGLWHRAGLTRPWNDPEADFDRALNHDAATVLLARDGAALAGSVMIGFDGHRGWVYYLASDPVWRGKGIARRLMQAAEAWLGARGCPKIQLMVRTGNAAAAGFYRAIGYAVQEVETWGRRLD